MYLVIKKCVTAVKVSNFTGHYLRNRIRHPHVLILLIITWFKTPLLSMPTRPQHIKHITLSTLYQFTSKQPHVRYHTRNFVLRTFLLRSTSQHNTLSMRLLGISFSVSSRINRLYRWQAYNSYHTPRGSINGWTRRTTRKNSRRLATNKGQQYLFHHAGMQPN